MVPLAEMIFCFVVFFYFLKLLPFTLLEELEMQVLLALKALAKSTPAQLFRAELGNLWLFGCCRSTSLTAGAVGYCLAARAGTCGSTRAAES